MVIMMIQIRNNIFETNSSSVHTLVICSEDEFNKFYYDELYYYTWTGELMTKKQKEEIEKTKEWYGEFLTFDDFFENTNLETFEEHKIIDGTPVVVFGRYGYDD